MKSPCHNFHEYDCKYRFNWYSERKRLANDASYKYVSEHIVKVYRRTKSQRLTGKECDMSTRAIGLFLKWCGEPIQPSGGANNQHNVRIDGLTLMQISKLLGLPYPLIHHRYNKGWSPEHIMIPYKLTSYGRKRYESRKQSQVPQRIP